MLACPFHIPRYEWDETVPFMRKCAMCFQRQEEGLVPACVDACPNEALRFGDRNDLLTEAREIIASGRGLYMNRIWGEHEFGGTSILYISDIDLRAAGWPDAEAESIPHLTEPLIAKTPFIGVGVMSSLLGINWVIRRRMRLARETGIEGRAEEPRTTSSSETKGEAG
jgi:formate dehydrogenase iron-sulfur subunit